jgi:DNA-binding beta-propeller fold protein YncE
MINTLTCSRYDVTGCTTTPPTVTVGPSPDAIAVDPLTQAVYVANGNIPAPGPSTVSVINAATCDATDAAGCSDVQTLSVPGGAAYDLVVDTLTDTLYVATLTTNGPDLLSVYNAATCDASDRTGCTQTPETVEVGSSGGGYLDSNLYIAVDQATNTIYATDYLPYNTDNDSVYVINGATCDANDTAGCGQVPMVITPQPAGTPGGVAAVETTRAPWP